MRRRVLDHIPANQAERQLKLGSGGLRDVEFAVQLLQMVHGRTDEEVRPPTTLSALARLTDRGYVGREDGRALHDAYAFLRMLEHRIQLQQLRRTHVMPEDEASLRRLGRSLGYTKEPVRELDKQWHFHQREVRRLHEKLFYRPLLSAVARISGDEARLSPEAARARLSALGYEDPTAALRHLEALTAGVTRTAQIQRTLLPVMLEWFADAPDPDAGLFGFRRISEALGATPWYLRLLRDEGEAAQRMAQVLATSRYATDLLEREPQGVAILGEQERLEPLTRDAVQSEMMSAAERREDAQEAVAAIRSVRRRELLRISVADLCVPLRGRGGRLRADRRHQRHPRGDSRRRHPVGREGQGRADADADGDHRDGPVRRLRVQLRQRRRRDVRARPVARWGHRSWPRRWRRRWPTTYASCSPPSPATRALEVDTGLRPEGRQGPLVRTLDSYAAYYGKWSAVWEAQALLRAAPIVGDPELRERFRELIDPLRFPEAGLTRNDVVEVRRIKARVDSERLPRGADPATHFKLGRGGLSDVEWTVQLLQMEHAGKIPEMRTTKTLEALQVAVENDLLELGDAEGLAEAWRFASRARNATVQVRGKPSDQLPRDARERAAVAAILQYQPGRSDEMLNDYLRTARRARGIVDRIFWS